MLSSGPHQPSYNSPLMWVCPKNFPVSTVCSRCVGPASSRTFKTKLGDTPTRSPGPTNMPVHWE